MDKQPTLDVAGRSDIGRRRAENQDHFLIADLHRQLEVVQTDIPLEKCNELYGNCLGRLMVIADGMGGHADGALASGTAVRACARYVLDMTNWFLKLSSSNEDDFKRELEDSLAVVQQSLYDRAVPHDRQMGTTVTMAYVVWPRLYVVHAGDSRCYLFRDNQLVQLTTDHTLAQKLLEDRAITPEEAATSRWRHVLWNCVGGSREQVETEVSKIVLAPRDKLLLCSDGLSGMLDDKQLSEALREEASSGKTVDRLIEAANQAGGTDNISVIVAAYGEEGAEDAEDVRAVDASLADTRPE
ncbi:PP2C family protein-serine/threonine phosphatase [Roseimaritima sediminicola]|uniref:PP2C family protein-serine/threonine phosphatase n=1 Tax=Roseimaritima sediminicola TaxID=2662066 RepID=UPI0012982DBA|nr:protein phosphatase 2C domain-containing protein [Roseimaritima sediminicola]